MNEQEAEINQIKDIIINYYEPDKIILFGSHARDDANQKSDIDIMVISDKEKQIPRYKRGLEVRLKLSKIKTPKDVLFYTHADMERWKGVKHTFIERVINEGIVLYER